jgi:hypothetical protein
MIWLILVVVLTIVALISFSQVKIRLHFSSSLGDDLLALEVEALFGLIKYRYKIPKIDFKGLQQGVTFIIEHFGKNVPEMHTEPDKQKLNINKDRILKMYDKFKLFLAQVFDFSEWIKNTLAQFCCTEFRWITRVGIGDAPATAVLTGISSGIKSVFLGYAFKFIRLQTKPWIHVQPQYHQVVFTTSLSCKLNIRLGAVLFSGILLGIRLWKAKGKRKVMQAANS